MNRPEHVENKRHRKKWDESARKALCQLIRRSKCRSLARRHNYTRAVERGCKNLFFSFLNQKPKNLKFYGFRKTWKIHILESPHSRKLLPFSLISCVYSYAIVCTWLSMWQNDSREFLGHNFASVLHTLKPKKPSFFPAQNYTSQLAATDW